MKSEPFKEFKKVYKSLESIKSHIDVEYLDSTETINKN